MSELRRTAIGPFHIDAACDLNMLTVETLPAELQPTIRAVEHLPRVSLTARQVTAVGHGQRIDGPKMASRPQVAAVDDNGQLVAILQAEENGRFKPIRVFRRGG